MMVESGWTYSRVDGLDCNEVPDGYLIYDERQGQVHFLNLTAAAVFELCDGRIDLTEIAAVVQDAFDLPSAPIAEVESCLSSLLSQGLVKPCSRSSFET